MRYFIYGYYGFGNFGDDLMLSAIVDQIRRRDRAARFTVKCRNTVAGLGPDVSFLTIDTIMEGAAPRWQRGWRYLRGLLAGLRGHDCLVIGGGALFLDKGRASAALLLLWCLVLRARISRIRVVIVGVSCDLLANPASLWLTRAIFRAADSVTVRDLFSQDYARYFGRSDVQLCADLSFAAPQLRSASPAPRPARDAGAKRRIGLCLVDYYAEYERDDASRRLFLDRMAASLGANADRTDYVYLSLQDDQGLGDNRMQAELSKRADFASAYRIVGVNDLARALTELDGVLTMRFHLGLLAAAFGLPVGVIYHELKMLSVGLLPGVQVTSCRQILDGTADPITRLLRGGEAALAKPDLAALARDAEANFRWLSPREPSGAE